MLKKKFGIVTLVCLLCLCVAVLFTACGGTQGEKGDKGESGTDGKDGVSIVSVEKTDSKGLTDTYTITYSDGKITTFTVTNGKDGVDGSDGEDGTDGENGKDGISITDVDINASGELVISFSEGSPVNLGKVVGADGDDGQDGKNGISIKGATVDDNGNLILTLSDESEINAGKVKGENGVDGKDGISISGVEINESGELVLSFSDGKQNNLGKIIGKDGKDGIGIAEIELDENYNLIIHYSNGETQNLGNIRGEKGEQGKDGVSIVSVEKTGTDGLKDTYMITYSDGKTTIFTVTNGKDGVDGSDGEDGISITDVDINESGELVISFSEGSPVNLGKIIGADGDDGQDGIGIEKARVDENGDLILTLSNATEINVGNVKGENGADGQNGISISGVEINELGELVISFSDGNQSNLGNIIGKDGTNGQDGVGIDRIELDNDCNLTIYLTNDTEIPLGCIRGEKGEAGQDGTDGKDGQDGKSAYELYKEQFGYEGTEQEWLIDLANGKLAVVQTHTVTFMVYAAIVDTQEVKHGEKLNRPSDPKLKGYIFDGWYYKDEEWSFIGYEVTEDMTLMAKWIEENPPCEVLNADGFITDNSGEIPVLSKTVPYATDRYDMSDDILVSNGCTWRLFADYYGEKEYGLKSVPLEEGDNEFHLVVFSADERRHTRYIVKIYRQQMRNYVFMNGETEVLKGTIEENTELETPPEISDEEGYTHYWSVNGERVEFPYTVTENTIFLAMMEPIQYKLSYELDGGRCLNGEPISAFTIKDLPLTVYFGPTIKNDYAFMGWYEEKDFRGESFSEFKITDIGDKTFYAKFIPGTNNLLYVEENGGYTVNRYSGSETEIVLPDYHADKPVLSIQGQNYDNSVFVNINSITFGMDTQLTSIGNYAFSGCSGLMSIEIPNSVTSIGERAFSGCSGLTSIEIPNGVTSIGESAFSGCSGLTSIEIPNGVTSIGDYAFYGCSGLTSIEIPSGVTSIGNYTFYNCSGLASIELPSGVTSIGNYTFYNCSSLMSIEIPSGVTSIGEKAFYGCSGLESITVEEGNNVYKSENNCLIEIATNTLVFGYKNSSIPSYITSIGASGFYGCSGLTSIEIPNSVTSIGNFAFSGCSDLTSVTFGENSQLTSIGERAFYGCSDLTDIKLPNSVTSIGSWAFSNCDSLTYFEIPSSITYISYGLFQGCDNLIGVRMLYNDDRINVGDNAFFGCDKLEWIIMPYIKLVAPQAFSGCASLKLVCFTTPRQFIPDIKYGNEYFNVPNKWTWGWHIENGVPVPNE